MNALIVSIHDICPEYEREFDQWLRLLDDWGVTRRSLHVIPNYRQSQRLADAPTLIAALRREIQNGSEVMLHGYNHVFKGRHRRFCAHLWERHMTHGCAEFSEVEAETARHLLQAGRETLQAALTVPITGFTAPGWWQSRAVAPVLAELGFHFYTTLWTVRYLRPQRVVWSPVLTGLPGRRGAVQRLLALYDFRCLPAMRWALFRIDLHPYDLENKPWMKRLERLVARLLARRRLTVYEEVAHDPAF